jgi:hypothetical protein
MRRYFELEAALAKEPTNRALMREFNEKEYYDFLKKDSERITWHEALRQSRRALELRTARAKNDNHRSKRDG